MPVPPGGHYAAVPTLVLSGELDSITTPAEGALVVGQIPGARQVVVANSFHVTATDDTDGCGRALVQAFVAAPDGGVPGRGAGLRAKHVPPVRAAPTYAKSFKRQRFWQRAGPGGRHRGPDGGRPDGPLAAELCGFGTGLRGGTWTSAGDHVVTLRLQRRPAGERPRRQRHGRLGTATAHRRRCTSSWRRSTPGGAVVHTDQVNGTLAGSWDTRAAGARVHLTGRPGRAARGYGFLAP